VSGRRLVVAALLVDELAHPLRVLAARRCTPSEVAGRWEFPGGKVDVGEEPEAALQREISEELGVEVLLGAELVAPGALAWPISDGYEMRTWWAQSRSGEPVALDAHDELRWVSATEIEPLHWLDADVAIARAVAVVLSGDGGDRAVAGVVDR
jgi:8-oxo-dGTP diphosphatase